MGRGNQALVQRLLVGDATLIHQPFSNRSQKSIAAFDLAQAVMRFGRDDVMGDAVTHVELNNFTSELASRIAAELQRQTQWSIPYLLKGSEHICWSSTFKHLGSVVGGSLARNAQDREVLSVNDPQVDNVRLDHLARRRSPLMPEVVALAFWFLRSFHSEGRRGQSSSFGSTCRRQRASSPAHFSAHGPCSRGGGPASSVAFGRWSRRLRTKSLSRCPAPVDDCRLVAEEVAEVRRHHQGVVQVDRRHVVQGLVLPEVAGSGTRRRTNQLVWVVYRCLGYCTELRSSASRTNSSSARRRTAPRWVKGMSLGNRLA